jgi:hypothetical protein
MGGEADGVGAPIAEASQRLPRIIMNTGYRAPY